jgi:hypothetical protein
MVRDFLAGAGVRKCDCLRRKGDVQNRVKKEDAMSVVEGGRRSEQFPELSRSYSILHVPGVRAVLVTCVRQFLPLTA